MTITIEDSQPSRSPRSPLTGIFPSLSPLYWQITGLIVVILLALPTSPLLEPVPHRDSGVFIYIADQMLDGAVPYRDVWDHKPPLIYAIDALGLALSGRSLWGVWAVQVLFLAGAVRVSYLLLEKISGKAWIAGVTTLWWLVALVPLFRSNFTEGMNLPFQFLALYLFYEGEKEGRYRGRGMLIGLLGGMSFLLKQNLIGVTLAIGLAHLILTLRTRVWERLLDLFQMVLGGALVIGVTSLAFAVQGALDDLIEAAFRYNAVLAIRSPLEVWESVRMGWALTAGAGLMYGTVAGWLGIPLIWKVWRAAPADPGDEVVPPGSHVLAVWLAFPLELLLSSITGRDFEQYYMAWVPSMALLTGYFLHFLSREIIPSEAVTFSRRNVPFVLLGLLIGGMWLQAIVDHAEKIAEGVSRIDQFDTVTGYLSFYTAPDEPVLMWGAETAYVFTSNRYSPTRYVYQYPLLYPEYVTDEKVNEFLHDLQADPPIVIMDTFPSNADVPPLDSLPGPIGDFFRANYDRAGTIDTTGWPVYRLKGHPETP